MGTEKNKGGRPRKEIDSNEFEKLCALQCTEAEICSWFDVTDKTLARWCAETYEGRSFSEVFEAKRGTGKIALRRSMMQLASKSAVMAIFLAKNWLGMSDNVEVKADTTLMQTLIDCVKGNQQAEEPHVLTDEELKNAIL